MFKTLIIVSLLIFSAQSFAAIGEPKNEKPKLNDDLIPYSDDKSEVDEISDEDLRKLAFEALKERVSKLTPEERRQIYELELQKSEATKRKTPLKALNDIISIDSTPGAEMQRIYVSPGQDTYLTIMDLTGEPWPIIDSSSGFAEDFPLTSLEEVATNKLKIRTNTRVGTTNLTLLLKDFDTPITIQLVASKTQYHAVAPIKIDTMGPNTKKEISYSVGKLKASDALENVILRLKPTDNSKRLKTNNENVMAWLSEQNELFIRTPLTLRNPRFRGVNYGLRNIKGYRTRYLPAITLTDEYGNEHIVELQEER